MNKVTNVSISGSVFALTLFVTIFSAQAEDVSRLGGGNPKSPIAQAVTVPEGFKTFYLSGTPGGSTGDTRAQTVSALAKIKDTLAALGLTFGDVVKATVFLVGDPVKGGEIDFPAMNEVWSEQFGTTEQPNKPARSTIKVAGLAGKGALVEIEMIAVKKN